MSNNAYIVSAVRTAGGKKNGSLSQWHPADLGAKVLAAEIAFPALLCRMSLAML